MIADHFAFCSIIGLISFQFSIFVDSRNILGNQTSHLKKEKAAAAAALLSLTNAPNDEPTYNKLWTINAINKMWAERKAMGATESFIFEPKGFRNVKIVFKNESSSPTESLKHRYAWALMTWALLEQHVREGTHVFEASSGNTACSLAYMCKFLGLNFTAVVPDTLEAKKQRRIRDQGGEIVMVPIGERLRKAAELARQSSGFFMNQFKNAFHAEEFHESGNDEKHETVNLLHEMLAHQQLHRAPDYFVHPAGTGGTLSSIGRFVKKYGYDTEIVLADTQFSVYYDYVLHGRFVNDSGADLWQTPGMAGIGYGPMGRAVVGETTSLDAAVIDRVLKLPDLASTAAMKVARDVGIAGGTSTGVNFLAALHIAAKSATSTNHDDEILIATILADNAKFYDESYYDRKWIETNFKNHGGIEVYDCWINVIQESIQQGSDPLTVGSIKCSN